MYFPEAGKVKKHRVVKFPSESVNKQQTQTESLLCDDDDFMLLRRNTNPVVHLVLTCLRKSQVNMLRSL